MSKQAFSFLNKLPGLQSEPAAATADDQLTPLCQRAESTVEPLQSGLEKISKRLEKCSTKKKKDEELIDTLKSVGESVADGAPQLARMLDAMYSIEKAQLDSRERMYSQLNNICKDKFKVHMEALKMVSKQRKEINKLSEELVRLRRRLAQQQQQQQQQQQPQPQVIADLQTELSTKSSELRRQRIAYDASLQHVTSIHSQCCADLSDMITARLNYHRECAANMADTECLLKDDLARIGRTSGPCYSVDLDQHLLTTERQIAYVLQLCIGALNKPSVLTEEGLFRTSGPASAVQRLESDLNLMQADASIGQFEASTVCGALKKYLKSLPTPLVGSNQLIDSWREACEMPDEEKRLEAFHSCCRELESSRPTYHRNLCYLVKFLARVTQQQEKNRMTPKNLGICIGPNIFYSCGEASGLDEMKAANIGSQLVENLLKWHEKLFGTHDPDFGLSVSADHLDGTFECQVPSKAPPSPLQPPPPPALPPPRRPSASDTSPTQTKHRQEQPPAPSRPPPPRTPVGLDSTDRPTSPTTRIPEAGIERPKSKPPPPPPIFEQHKVLLKAMPMAQAPQQQFVFESPQSTTADQVANGKSLSRHAESGAEPTESAKVETVATASSAASAAPADGKADLKRPGVPPPPPPPPPAEPQRSPPSQLMPTDAKPGSLTASPSIKRRAAPQPPRPPPPSTAAAAAKLTGGATDVS